jgi:hypothetical protein
VANDRQPFPNPNDKYRARIVAAGVLVIILCGGVAVNLYTGQERFSIAFFYGDLLAVGGLLGLNWRPGS